MGSSASVASKCPENPKNFVADYDNLPGPFWTVDATAEVQVHPAEAGPASLGGAAGGWTPQTIPTLFKSLLATKGGKTAIAVEAGLPIPKTKQDVPPATPLSSWKKWTYQQYYDEICAAAKGMIKYGLSPHDAVSIYGFNSPEWHMAEYAAIFAGAMAAGIYPSDTPEQVLFKCKHSGAAVAVCEDVKKFNNFVSNIEDTPKLKVVVCWDHTPTEKTVSRQDGTVIHCITWAELLEAGKETEDAVLTTRMDDQKPGHCCALIYTSGTTGNPKAVMISHDNILFESWSALQNIPNFAKTAGKPERIISYLPLSHVAGMMVDIVCPIVGTALQVSWCEVYFARAYDLKLMSLAERIKSIKPTIFIGVPRVWEKIGEAMKAVGLKTKGLKKKVSTFAKKKGLQHQLNCQLGGSGAYPSMYGVANKVLKKVKAALGLDECHFGFTGAAPISVETLTYFGQLGIQINEVYGMSECTGATTWSTNACHVWGSCGFVMPGVEVKILDSAGKECPAAADIFNASEESQGEICFRGRHNMMGYMANPDLGEEHVAEITAKTKESIDDKGWLHSGDKGCIGTNGMVKITGRYKELIIGAGGENIAPVPIEDDMKKICEAVSNVQMIGDKRKFNIALITLKVAGATGELPGGDELTGPALLVDGKVTKVSEAIKSEKFCKHVEECLIKTNANAPNSASKIQKFTILLNEYSSDTGELTPTFKLKRGVVEKKYADLIEKVYASKDTYVCCE